MNKRRTRLSLTALLMALLMVLSCGCAGDPSAPTTESTPTTATTQSTTAPEKVDPNAPVDRVGREVDSITLAEGGKTEYRLIFPLGASGWKKELSMWFCDVFERLTGARLETCDDFEAEDEPHTLRTAKEIVIGSRTTREDLYTVDYTYYQKGYDIFVNRERLIIAADCEYGLWSAMVQFFRDAFGVDVSVEEEIPALGANCTIDSTYGKTLRIRNAAFVALGNVSENYQIVVDASDEMQVRFSYRLQSSIKYATGESFEITGDRASAGKETLTMVTDPTLKNGDWTLSVANNCITVSAGDYYGFTGIAAYLETCASKGTYAHLQNGVTIRENYRSTLTELTQSTAYAFEHAGDVRVMFHNVLFYDPLPAERNLLQAEMFGIYLPDVIGLQEFNSTKRAGAGANDLCRLLAEYGYVETIDPNVKNAYATWQTIPGANRKGYGTSGSTSVKVNGESYRTYFNHTPLFYNTNTTTYIDGGYYWYIHQVDVENTGNCGAGDCASKSLTWGVFEDKETKGRYIVISTHMCTRSSGVRRQQGYEVLALLEEILAVYDYPVFFGGDMNSSLHDDNCKIFVEEGGLLNLCTSDLATEYTAKIGTSHAYPFEFDDKILGKTTVTGGGRASMSSSGGIDHIFVTNVEGVEIKVYGGVIDLYAEAGSDHVPLFTDFSFLPTS